MTIRSPATTRLLAAATLALGAWLLPTGPLAAATVDLRHAFQPAHQHAPIGSHASVPEVRFSMVAVDAPPVKLLRADGKAVDLAAVLNDPRPLLLNFIYTRCDAICPIMSLAFASVQNRLGADRTKVRMLSISIDPEHDTANRLAVYGQQFNSGPGWDFLTGTPADSVAVQRAFGSHRKDKTSLEARTYLRTAPGKVWMRIDGLATPEQLLQPLREALRSR